MCVCVCVCVCVRVCVRACVRACVWREDNTRSGEKLPAPNAPTTYAGEVPQETLTMNRSVILCVHK